MTSTKTEENRRDEKSMPKITPIGDYASIEEFAKNGLAEIVQATKTVNAYPQGPVRDLYCSYPAYGKIIDQQSDEILGLISKALKWQNIKGNIQKRQKDEQFEMVLECNDAIMERLNINLDAMSGIKPKNPTVILEQRRNFPNIETESKAAGSWNRRKPTYSPQVIASRQTAKVLSRPQLKFAIPVDNSSDTPFIPKIKDKPNSLKPLAVLPEYDDNGEIVRYLHPYEFELMKFQVPAEQLKSKNPTMPPNLNESEFVYVETVRKLQEVLNELRGHNEIAIDLEHHSYRSFLGFTCLMQISTRAKDYIFDTLILRENLHVLNEIFTDPKVLKIFHGADSDIEWLQRDLSLYIVNMFDTHQAAKSLNFPRLSLAFLLKHYCNIDADKSLQLADWRMRPLSKELIDYGRQDTHYLIYIYERLNNDLLEMANGNPNMLLSVYQRSTELCKKRYEKPNIGPDSYMDIYRKSKRLFNNRQLFALRGLFQWRERVARAEDESYGYVLPNHMMLQIAENLPREMQGILACCNPIPLLVRHHLHELHEVVLRAREQPLIKPILEQEHRLPSSGYYNPRDYNNKLYCPFDLSHEGEFRDDLPTLLSLNDIHSSKKLQPNRNQMKPASLPSFAPKINIFETNLCRNHQNISQSAQDFITPYQRYLAILPMVEQENQAEAARIAAEMKARKLCPDAPTELPIFDQKTIKQEPVNELLDAPIKELLKRKYDESVAKKTARKLAESDEIPDAKRLKIVTPIDDKLNLNNLKDSVRKSAQNSKEKHKFQFQLDVKPSTEPTTNKISSDKSLSNRYSSNKNKRQSSGSRVTKTNQTKQSSDVPVQANFDYKSVDYKKFQGGAQHAKPVELKPQFHGKGNSNKVSNKKFNKLFTFSNVKGKK